MIICRFSSLPFPAHGTKWGNAAEITACAITINYERETGERNAHLEVCAAKQWAVTVRDDQAGFIPTGPKNRALLALMETNGSCSLS